MIIWSFRQGLSEANRDDTARGPTDQYVDIGPPLSVRHIQSKTMRDNVLTLAVVALLALSASGVVAASIDTPNADTTSATASPANYTVDISNPDAVSEEEVDQAIKTAWANDTVQSYFNGSAAVHFEVWASEFDEEIVHVKVAPQDAPEDTRVVADVDLDKQTVTSVDEPVTLNASNAVSLNAADYDIVSADGDELELNQDNESSDENVTKIPADQLSQIQLNESSIARGSDGTFTFQIGGGDETTMDVSSEDIIQIVLSPVR